MPLTICSPCFKQDKINDAVKFCKKCQESLCDTCERSHPRGWIFTHTIINIQECVSQQLPTETCKIHSKMPVEFYCTTHKEVGCKECKRVKHGLVFFIYIIIKRLNNALLANTIFERGGNWFQYFIF